MQRWADAYVCHTDQLISRKYRLFSYVNGILAHKRKRYWPTQTFGRWLRSRSPIHRCVAKSSASKYQTWPELQRIQTQLEQKRCIQSSSTHWFLVMMAMHTATSAHDESFSMASSHLNGWKWNDKSATPLNYMENPNEGNNWKDKKRELKLNKH